MLGISAVQYPVLQNSSFQLDKILDISNVDLSLADVENALGSLDSKTSFDSDGVANIVINKYYLHSVYYCFYYLRSLCQLASFRTDGKFQNLFQSTNQAASRIFVTTDLYQNLLVFQKYLKKLCVTNEYL